MVDRSFSIGSIAARGPAGDDGNLSPNVHTPQVAAEYGFTSRVVQGVRVMEAATRSVIKEHGLDWLHGGRVWMRHRRPVYEDMSLRVRLTPAQDDVAVNVEDESRTVVAVGGMSRAGHLGGTLPAPPAPPTLTAPDTPVRVRSGEVTVGTYLIGAPLTVDEEALERLGHPWVNYSLGERLPSVALMVALAGRATFDSLEFASASLHYASDVRSYRPVAFGSSVRSVGTVVETFERNGNDYFVAQFTAADDEGVFAVVRQTVLYHMAIRPTTTQKDETGQ